MNLDGNDEFLGLIHIGWDTQKNIPIAALTIEPWDRLTIEQESEVWELLAEVCLDYAQFGIPDTVAQMFEE